MANESALTHYAPVDHVGPYGEGGKHKLVFSERAKEIPPIPFGDAAQGAMQGPRYTTFAKLMAGEETIGPHWKGVTHAGSCLSFKASRFAAGLSKTAQKKFSETLKARLIEHTHDVILPFFEGLLTPVGKRERALELSKDGERVRIYYPSVFRDGENVLVEFGGRNVTEPNEEHSIRPYIAEEVKDLEYPCAKVRVLSPLRTFWEKATMIHVECNRPKPRMDADRLSRHWSDLAALADHEIGKRSVADRKLLADVVKHKKVFFYSAHANYDACLRGKLRLAAGGPLLEALKADFEQMVGNGMFDVEPPSFDRQRASGTRGSIPEVLWNQP